VAPLEALLITGTIGAGKTTVATEICDLLGDRRVPAAAVDLDWLSWTSLRPPEGIDAFIALNLKTLIPNFVSIGITHMVLTRAIQKLSQVETIRDVLFDVRLQVVLLESPKSFIESRLRNRDHGTNLVRHLAETEEFRRTEPGLQDVTVSNDDRPAREVAEEVLTRAGWIP
jgi:adenylylsulfate kinase